MACAFLWRYQIYSSSIANADAWGYQFYAFRFRIHGLFHDFGTIRTYAYPLFLYPLTYISGFDFQKLSLAAGATQYGLFIASSLWLYSLLNKVRPILAQGSLIGLLLNPYLLGLVTDTLTEGLSIPIFVALAALALYLQDAKSDSSKAICILMGALLAAFGLMVRPGNLPVIAAWYSALLLGCLLAPQFAHRRVRMLLLLGTTFGAAAICVWGPQVAYTIAEFGQAAFLPVCRLGDLQVSYGISLWKYDTIVLENKAASLYYLNPLLSHAAPIDEGWLWYLHHPLNGLATILAHIFNAFSVTTLFTYISDQSTSYGAILRFVYWIVILAGALHAVSTAYTLAKQGRLLAGFPKEAVAVGFVFLSFVGIVILNSITAIELRFNAIPIAILSVLAATYFLHRARWHESSFLRIGLFLAVASLCTAGSYAMDRLAVRPPLGPQIAFDPLAANCRFVGDFDGTNTDKIFTVFDTEMRAENPQYKSAYFGHISPSDLPKLTAEPLGVGLEGIGKSALTKGWSTPEAWGAWSSGKSGQVGFLLDSAVDPKSVKAIELDVIPFQRQRIEVAVLGKVLVQVEISEPTKIEVPLHEVGSVNQEAIILDFSFPSALSPRDVGMGQDTRLLAIGLRSARLILIPAQSDTPPVKPN
jgi:hypothetical protein